LLLRRNAVKAELATKAMADIVSHMGLKVSFECMCSGALQEKIYQYDAL
jgi:hypothetical protein